jgi:hypothetical protein
MTATGSGSESVIRRRHASQRTSSSVTDEVTKHVLQKTFYETEMTSLRQVLGFKLADFSSWNAVVRLFHKPVDGSSLAVFRILFGKFRCQVSSF